MAKLETFLKRVDSAASDMTAGQLRAFVHEIARECSENRRDYFLNAIKTVASSVSSNQNQNLTDDFELIKETLKKIDNGLVCLDSMYSGDWDESFDEDAEPILFSDPGKIIPDIEEAIKFVHKCVTRKLYGKAYEIVQILLNMNITADGDYMDYYDGLPLKIVDLNANKLLKVSFRNFVQDALLLTYINNDMSDRPEKLCLVIGKCVYYDIKFFEKIMDLLPDFKDFLPLWTDYLSKSKSTTAKKMLSDAQLLRERESK